MIMVQYAGEHLLDLLDVRADATDPGARGYEKNEMNEKRATPGKLVSFNSSISYPQVPPPADQQDGLASLPADIVQGLGRLLTMPAPRRFEQVRWSKAVKHAIRFAADWAAVALRLGWTVEELFGLHPVAPDARYDARGLAFAQTDDRCIVAITESTAVIRTSGGANLTFYRRQYPVEATLAWELRGDGSDGVDAADEQ
jgi:hypothetical protein